MSADETSSGDPAAPTIVSALLRHNAWALAGLLAATLLVELGVFAGGRMLGIGPKASALAALAAAVVWTALAAPAAAAGGRDTLASLLRAGTVADASAVALVALWLIARNPDTGDPYVTFLAAVKIYCTLAAMALAAAAVVLCARSASGRGILCVCVAAGFMVLLTSLLWVSIPLAAAPEQTQARIATAAVWLNPFCSVASAVVRETQFVWHGYGMMYSLSPVYHYPMASVPWYAASVCLGCVGGMAAAGAFLRRRAARRPPP